MPSRARLLALAFALVACGHEAPTAPTLLPDGGSILFIGNAQSEENDIGGMVAALADSASGASIGVGVVQLSAFAVIDHWNVGFTHALTARSQIAKGGWSVVVLQQGPSSADLARDTLRLATRFFDAEIRKIGARTALFSSWPHKDAMSSLDRSIESYALAAADVGGVLLPIGAAWKEALRRDPKLDLLWDGIHAKPLGSYLGALTIYATLSGRSPIGLPAALTVRDGTVMRFDPSTARMLQEVVAEVVRK